MQTPLKDLIEKRRDRAIAKILGVKEREIDPHVPAYVSQKLRKVVLDQVNEFADVILDVMGSLDSGEVILNEAYLERLGQIHEAIAEVKDLVSNGSG